MINQGHACPSTNPLSPNATLPRPWGRALRRELHEELSLNIAIGQLLTLDWIGPHGPWDDQLAFMFDGGTLADTQIDRITLSDKEISEYRFFPLSEAVKMLRVDIAQRLTRALDARRTGHTHYAETRK